MRQECPEIWIGGVDGIGVYFVGERDVGIPEQHIHGVRGHSETGGDAPGDLLFSEAPDVDDSRADQGLRSRLGRFAEVETEVIRLDAALRMAPR